MERVLIEYIANCAWQVPLLAAGAWLMVKIVRPSTLVQHWVWLSVLALAVTLPMRGIERRHDAVVTMPVAAEAIAIVPTNPFRQVPAPQTVWGRETRHRQLRLGANATHWIVAVYMATILLGAVRFGRSWIAAMRLVTKSRETTLSKESLRVFERYAGRLGINVPRLLESSEIAGPIVVGAIQPVLLLPERFREHAEEEIKAALYHELAHVSRRDYFVNMVCQIAALPVMWHPATTAIHRHICRTREMICDAMAAEEMHSGARYARCLVSLAQGMIRQEGKGRPTQAIGLFERNTIEERVMRLTETKAATSVWGKVIRAVGGMAAMAAVTMTAAAFHVRPAFAETVATAQTAPVMQQKPSAQVTPPSPGLAAGAKAEVETAKKDEAPTVLARGRHAAVTAQKGDYVHQWTTAEGEPFTMVNQSPKEPTEAEKLRVEAQLKEPLVLDLDQPLKLKTDSKLLIDPEFTIKLDALQKNIDSVEMKKQMEKANRMMNDPALRRQMEELQKKMPEIEAQANLAATDALKGNIKLQMQLDDLKHIQPDIDLENFQLKADAFQGDKFKVMMDSQMKDAKKQMTKAQKEFESGEMKRKLEAAEQMLQDVKRQMEKMQAK